MRFTRPWGSGLSRADDPAIRSAISSRRPEAIDELYRRNGATLYRLALILCQDSALAETAVSGAFRALWKNADLRSEEPSLYDALVGETYARCEQDSSAGGNGAGPTPRVSRIPRADDQSVAPPFDIVPRPHRDLLALTVVAGYTHRQAARRAGLSEDAGAPLLSSALRTVRAAQVLAEEPAPSTREAPSFGSPAY